jgi:hypothetical protein
MRRAVLGRHDRDIFGKLAASLTGYGRRRQTSWSIRVPCPGGSGAGVGGWAVLASSLSLSLLTTGVVVWVGAYAGCMGAGAEMLEILMANTHGQLRLAQGSPGHLARLCRGLDQRLVNPTVKRRTIGPVCREW